VMQFYLNLYRSLLLLPQLYRPHILKTDYNLTKAIYTILWIDPWKLQMHFVSQFQTK